jgi:hypothetical protein
MKKLIIYAFTGAICMMSFAFYADQAKADRWTEQVRQQIRVAEALWLSSGYTKSHDTYYGDLRDGSYNNVSLNLRKGYRYNIVGLCDNDCRDIDLFIYDENNNLIARDVLTDSAPIVEVAPRWTGPFQLRISMADCRVNPCRYAVTVYAKRD